MNPIGILQNKILGLQETLKLEKKYNLATASEEELIQELYKRFEACIIIYDKATTYVGQLRTSYRAHGSQASALGLIKWAEIGITKDMMMNVT